MDVTDTWRPAATGNTQEDLPAPARLKVMVQAARALTSRVTLYELQTCGPQPLPRYEAGAHIRVPVVDKHGLQATRSYSLLDVYHPGKPYQIAVQREEGGQGGSVHVHEHFRQGKHLELTPPVNRFALAEAAMRHILVAGGIGITPLLCMARTLEASGAEYVLHYAARTPVDMAFRAEIEAECGSKAQLYFDGGQPGKGMNCGEVLSGYQPGWHVYTCGPQGLIQAVRQTATACGWRDDAIHDESFTALPAEPSDDAAIEVVLANSGETIHVPGDQTILDALLEAGVETYYDCRVGECGSCVVGVVDGVPLHRDVFLNSQEHAEGKQICICVSRAKSRRLILDI
jgi:vanillate O-demethylase ferredoxin subunit